MDAKDASIDADNTAPAGAVTPNGCGVGCTLVTTQPAVLAAEGALINPVVNNGHYRRVDHALTWSGALQYDVAQHVMAYASMSNGFKDGGYNARASTSSPSFNPEYTLNYELGAKSEFFDDKLLINADVYKMIISGFQESELQPGSGVLFSEFNAGTIHEQGVEADLQARPVQYLSLNADMSYADTEYEKFNKGTCVNSYPVAGAAPPPGSPQTAGAVAGYCNFAGFTPPFAPNWRWNIGARWEQPWRDSHIQWYVSGNVHYTGGQFMDASLDPRSWQAGYTLLDANLGIESDSGNWKVQLFGRNLANKMYYVSMGPQVGGGLVDVVRPAGLGAASTGVNGFVGFYGQPRTFGIEGSYKF
jgi:iron complex outermembrane receptor protein